MGSGGGAAGEDGGVAELLVKLARLKWGEV